jgi:drug/metabolite transporter (DMT)-like permease
VTRLQWLAIVTGFAGAILIIRPTGGDTSLWALLILGSVFCYAGYQILTRTVAGVDDERRSRGAESRLTRPRSAPHETALSR